MYQEYYFKISVSSYRNVKLKVESIVVGNIYIFKNLANFLLFIGIIRHLTILLEKQK